MTITEFLLTRIAEDDAAARETMENVEYRCSPEEGWLVVRGNSCCDCGAGGYVEYGPDRLLAECAAKRAIVDLHFECRWAGVPSGCSICRTLSSIPDTYPCRTVRHLAAVYDSHPDYDETWKP